MIYLDTHVVAWLYAGLTDKLRDPFDRLITANALLNNNILLSKDENILNNYVYAKWRD